MRIAFDIDIADDTRPLMAALECTEGELNDILNAHAKAALSEYLECYVGRRAFARGSDILEHRLSLLITHAFNRQIPTAAKVSNLFQTTLSASRTLIRNTFSKYRHQLVSVEEASAKRVLEAADWSGNNGWFANVTTPNLVETLNRKLLAASPTSKEVARVPSVVGVYHIDQDAYDVLCPLFGATAKARPR